jgi:hypothetical protein
MIEPGQLRRWTYAGPFSSKLFLVLEHAPFPLTGVGMDDGWVIMETGDEPYWEAAVHIQESSEVCNPDGGVV